MATTWRIAPVLALLSAIAPITTASAHLCSSPAVVDVRKPVTISLGVPAEEKGVVAVEVALPEEFRLDDAEPVEGWTAEPDGSTVRFRGGYVQPFGCEAQGLPDHDEQSSQHHVTRTGKPA